MILRHGLSYLLVVLLALILPPIHEAVRRVAPPGLRAASSSLSSSSSTSDDVKGTTPRVDSHEETDWDEDRGLQGSGSTTTSTATETSLLCHIYSVQTRLSGFPDIVDEEHYECFPWTGDGESTKSYLIDLPQDFTDTYAGQLSTGDIYVMVPNATMDDQQVSYPPNATVTLVARRALRELGIVKNDEQEHVNPYHPANRRMRQTYQNNKMDPRHRHLQTDIRTVLIVRVRTSDAKVAISKATLNNYFFNTTAPSLRSNYWACSHGKVLMTNTPDDKTYNIVGGVMDIFLRNYVANGTPRSVLKNAASDALTKLMNVNSLGDKYDHVAYCLPPGTDGDWLSYGFINYFETVYNNDWCTYVSALVHEFGHNFGQLHSHEKFKPYADRSCSMGFSYPVVQWPSMCFNAHKYYHFGWFHDATATVDPSTGGLYKLIAPSDYDNRTPDQHVIIHVLNPGNQPVSPGGLDGQDFYMMWNLRKGENINVISHPNTTTIVQEYIAFSNMVAALDFKTTYTIPYAFSTPDDMAVVKLCDYVVVPGAKNPDYITVSISRNGDNCGGPFTTTDDCVDDDTYKFVFGSSTVTCQWLSLRPTYYDSACSDPDVATHCRQTCKKC